MTPHAFAATFVDELAQAGVRSVCISPGSRSAPLALAFARHPEVRVYMHVDERSGSFFAVGMAKASGKPVALLCTSGTAAAEFYAAVIEASQARVPLVVLTADRPPELRDTGANQSIDQHRLYGTAPRWFFDASPPDDAAAPRFWRWLAARAVAEATGASPGPVHVNLQFREPLSPPPGEVPAPLPGAAPRLVRGAGVPTPEMVELLFEAVRTAQRPVLVAGELPDGARLCAAVDRLAMATGAVVLAEPTSQLRVAGVAGLVVAHDAIASAPWAEAHRPDLVIRVGAPPTSRSLSQWLGGPPKPRTIVIDPAGGWRDPDRTADEVLECDPLPLLSMVEPSGPDRSGWQRDWLQGDAAAVAALEGALRESPLHEGHAVRALAARLPAAATVAMGSSMPIRSAATFWPAAAPGQRFFASRGASGIDGFVSTGLGISAALPQPTVLLVGDLTLYHDMNGLWAIRRHALNPKIVVLDNGGGGIFSFLPHAQHEDVFEELFLTPLGLDFENVARLYGLEFCSADNARDLDDGMTRLLSTPGPAMLSVRFCRDDTVAGLRAATVAVADALAALVS